VLAPQLRTEKSDQNAALIDRIGELLAEMSRRHPQVTLRPLTPASAYVLTRAVMGAIRSAVVENNRILDEPEFEDELVRLAYGYLRGRPIAHGSAFA
jgi:hypothetical protein